MLPGNMSPISGISPLLIAFILLSACSEQGNAPATSKHEAVSDKQVVQQAAAVVTNSSPSANHGIVISAQSAGGYTYINVDINGQPFWVAASMAVVKPGDKIRWHDFAMMKNFKSKQLNKTFDQIMFVDRVIPVSEQANGAHTGVIVSIMNSAGYSYIEVEENGSKLWLAAPIVEFTAGQMIQWIGGSPMRNFSSKSLDRIFEEIYFVVGVQLTES